MQEFIAYQRCSIAATGGLESQRLVIQQYAARVGAIVTASYEEIETGRKHFTRNRPQLEKAIAHSRRIGATLVIASLDRLTRSVLVTTMLLASGVDFVAVDAPHANRFTIVLLAAMAEHEGRLISERTKAAMDAARARGMSFARTSWHFSAETRLKAAIGAARSHRARAREAYSDLTPIAVTLRESGETWTAIARYLNELGHVTRSGGRWSIHTTRRLVERDSYVERESRKLVLAKFNAVVGQRASQHLAEPVAQPPAPLPEDVPHVPYPNEKRVAIAYLRVSTKMQGFGGLGIAAQRATVRAHAERSGQRVLHEYVEIENGTKSEKARPQLAAALAHAKAVDGVLLIARLDRLARSVAVTSHLLDAGVHFVCCDAPYANIVTIQMLSILAEHETRMLSQRMRAAIAASKAAGRNRRYVSNLTEAGSKIGIAKAVSNRIERTRAAYAYVAPLIVEMRDRNMSFPKIAEALRSESFVTQGGGPMDEQTVRRVYATMRPGRRAKAYRLQASRSETSIAFDF